MCIVRRPDTTTTGQRKASDSAVWERVQGHVQDTILRRHFVDTGCVTIAPCLPVLVSYISAVVARTATCVMAQFN